MKPICFLDVDGVLNAFPALEEEHAERIFDARGFTICYNKGLIGRIKRLAEHFEMVWLTTWEESANEHFVHHFIEPDDDLWPVVFWHRSRWKMWGAEKWMKETGNFGRPFVQIDDDLHFEQQELALRGGVESRFPQEKLFIAPKCAIGLTDSEVDRAIEWANAL